MQVILDCGVLPYLLKQLSHEKSTEETLKATCLTIKNMTAGTKEQIAAVVQEGESL